jgi:hypothetical protein
MRIREILTENAGVMNILQRDCGKWINESQGAPVFRGINNARWKQPIKKFICPWDRQPRNTDRDLHRAADAWFLKHTGIEFRSNSFFTTGNAENANEYGDLFILCPIGNYKYCWSPNIMDFYLELERVSRNQEDDDEFVDWVLTDGDYIFNSNLPGAIQSGNEIMVHCKEAYLVNPDFYTL